LSAQKEISPELREARSRAGQVGTLHRWGPRRIARLDQLDPAVAAAVRALIEADTAAKRARLQDGPEAAA
jgi:hypothetical protein